METTRTHQKYNIQIFQRIANDQINKEERIILYKKLEEIISTKQSKHKNGGEGNHPWSESKHKQVICFLILTIEETSKGQHNNTDENKMFGKHKIQYSSKLSQNLPYIIL